MSREKSLFSLHDIRCFRGGRQLFQNLNLDLNAGHIVQLTGVNGVGKTSLLRVMAGRLAAEGEILWRGAHFLENGQEEHAKRFAILTADDRYLKVLETASENLSFWCKVWGVGNVLGSLRQAGLASLKDTAVRSFSAGQKRRLSLARVFLKPAPLWLLDEPLNGLDAEGQKMFFTALEKHAAAGGMAVVASHQDIPGAAKIVLKEAA